MSTSTIKTGIDFADHLVSSGVAVSANLYGEHLEMKIRTDLDAKGCFKVTGTVDQVRSCIGKIVDRFGNEPLKSSWERINGESIINL